MITDKHKATTAGFTLVEVIVVLAVMAILAGASIPLVAGFMDRQREDEVKRELAEIAVSLEEYYFDHGSFPTGLRAADFFGLYLQPGFEGTAVIDAWAAAGDYAYVSKASPDSVQIHSVGRNGVDDAGQSDDLVMIVHGSVPGYRKTRSRMRLLVEVLANYLESGGHVSGDWSTDRKNMGLSDSFAIDGFGTAFRLAAKSYTLRSAGPDRKFETSDDLSY